MITKETAVLSTRALIGALFQAGFKNKAKQLGREHKMKKKELSEAINKAEYFLKAESSSTELASILGHLAQAQRKVRFEKGQDYLIIHSIDEKNVLIESVHNAQHTFSVQSLDSGFYSMLCEFYGFDPSAREDPVKMNLEIDTETYDLIHAIEREELEKMIRDESYEHQIRRFLEDFKANGQSVNSIDYTKNTHNQADSTVLFVPGKEYIWSIDYQQVKNNQIIATSSTVEQYFRIIERSLEEFLTVTVAKKKNSSETKPFSIQRGISFFVKGNVLLIVMLLLFNVNKNSWVEEGGSYVWLFGLQTEVIILLLSFIACLRPKTVKKAS
ncbi:hypothetical protein [Bacillus sp. CECT 9360]|uniref:hypothetical protein n=1 Tax=Bacillus sp. CECT 9360 TaxID=2845821 RepID=UPI001E4FE93B|nr:hypothetical protein [Bacillus sp. CECT 9360]CAH0345441.1 hypothetical protein BCI9360_01727 [Bacillus sp. CECT 9360]